MSATPERRKAYATIRNKKGLHARASHKFVKCANGFKSRIEVGRVGEAVGAGSATVGAGSIMGLLMLAAGPGTTIEMTAEGPDAEAALLALVALVESGFGEAE